MTVTAIDLPMTSDEVVYVMRLLQRAMRIDRTDAAATELLDRLSAKLEEALKEKGASGG